MKIFLLMFIIPMVAPARDICSRRYRRIPRHTACLRDSRYVVYSGVSRRDKSLILRRHNDLRRNVRARRGKPTDLLEIVWDNKLAAIAEKWARQCTPRHDRSNRRRVLEFPRKRASNIGQNLMAGVRNWSQVLRKWKGEGRYYHYGRRSSRNYATKDYIQMIDHKVSRIGCGFAVCNNRWRRIFVCNYYNIGKRNPRKPFKVGRRRCSACPGNCVNGLCARACRGKICAGSLDLSTCRCR